MRLLPQLPDKSVTMTCTDIPYGEVNKVRGADKPFGGGTKTRQAFTLGRARVLHKGAADELTFALSEFVAELVRVTAGSIYIFCGTEQVSELRRELGKYPKCSTRLLIWEKTNPMPLNAQYMWLSGIECCVYGRFPNATFNGHCLSPVLRYPIGTSKLHPTQKNLELIARLIEVSSNPGDIVLDPCMGSGTTGVAAYELGRGFIGMEQQPEYFQAALTRLPLMYPGSVHQ